jgi:hypothetical protein
MIAGKRRHVFVEVIFMTIATDCTEATEEGAWTDYIEISFNALIFAPRSDWFSTTLQSSVFC